MTPRILALDTTAEFGSIALLQGTAIVADIPLHSAEGFGQVLFRHLEMALRNAGWPLPSVDLFAVATGPGSFTGVRVGLAAAKGLAEALGRPVAGVSNLEAIAWHGTAPLRAAVSDARRGQVYAAVYDDQLSRVLPQVVTRFPEWLKTLPGGPIEFLSTDFSPFRAALAGTRFEHSAVREVPRALAAAIGRIAFDRFRADQASDAAAIDANYVRRSDAELFWKDE